MKTMLSALMALCMSLSLFAQDGKEVREKMKDFSPEQIATIKTKKMVLSLDLSSSQESKVYDLLLAQIKDRKDKRLSKEAREKLSSDQRYALMNEKLDAQIAFQRKMNSILDDKQYEQWKKNRKRQKMAKKHKWNKKRKQAKKVKAHKRQKMMYRN
ncbi:MAG: hypothetical protein OIF50_08530 [Flavobacteriaceae bacterium]|nr:hypothetical protein [Flavobacteriaceae bacterium]